MDLHDCSASRISTNNKERKEEEMVGVMKKLRQGEQGLTLIALLIALAILGIVVAIYLYY